MKLHPDDHTSIFNIDQSYNAHKKLFEAFYNAFQSWTSQQKLQNLIYEPNLANDYFLLLLGGIHLKFQFSLISNADKVLRGQVFCLRERLNNSASTEVIGSFTFNGRGITDIDPDRYGDAITIQDYADDIIEYYINEALSRPLYAG